MIQDVKNLIVEVRKEEYFNMQDLVNATGVSSNTIYRFMKNESLSLESIDLLCDWYLRYIKGSQTEKLRDKSKEQDVAPVMRFALDINININKNG